MNRKNIHKNEKGFTLLELMVATSVFIVIMTAIVGIFLSAVKSQRQAFMLQDVQESARYILESMVKEIRMSSVRTTVDGEAYALSIDTPGGQRIVYQFIGGNLQRDNANLNPTNIEMIGRFYIKKTVDPNPATARVTIVMKVKIKNPPAGLDQKEIKLQSTVASR